MPRGPQRRRVLVKPFKRLVLITAEEHAMVLLLRYQTKDRATKKVAGHVKRSPNMKWWGEVLKHIEETFTTEVTFPTGDKLEPSYLHFRSTK